MPITYKVYYYYWGIFLFQFKCNFDFDLRECATGEVDVVFVNVIFLFFRYKTWGKFLCNSCFLFFWNGKLCTFSNDVLLILLSIEAWDKSVLALIGHIIEILLIHLPRKPCCRYVMWFHSIVWWMMVLSLELNQISCFIESL